MVNEYYLRIKCQMVVLCEKVYEKKIEMENEYIPL